MQAPKARYLSRVDFDTGFVPDLEEGRWAIVSVRYQPIVDYARGAIAGQCSGNVNHFMVLSPSRIEVVPVSTEADSLCDGRCSSTCPGPTERSGCTVANGPQTIPLSVVKEAAGKWVTSGGTYDSLYGPRKKAPSPRTVAAALPPR